MPASKPLAVVVAWACLAGLTHAGDRGVAGCPHLSVNAPSYEDARWTLQLWHAASMRPAVPVILHWQERPGAAAEASAWLAGGSRRRHLVWIICSRKDYPRVLAAVAVQLARLEQTR